jgi:hypothetical protein
MTTTSSLEALDRVTKSGHRHTNAEAVLRTLSAYDSHTAAELTRVLDLDVVEIRRRLYDLHLNSLVLQGDRRKCRVAKTSAIAWEITTEGRELVRRMA